MRGVAAFVLARLDEWEQAARAAIGSAAFAKQTGRWSFEWVYDPHGKIPIVFAVADNGVKTQAANLETAWERQERGTHIALHDPAQVLAEVAALRAIVERFELLDRMMDEPRTDTLVGEWSGLRQAVTALAGIWAEHPDYNQLDD